MEFGQVHHIEYYVNDLEKSNLFWDWFMQILSYKKVAEWQGGVSWEHKTGTYLCFVQVEKEFLKAKNSRQGNGLNHIAFSGGGIEQLDNLQSELETRKVKILKRDEKYLCFEDPNQFAVEVYAQ
ncbi:MAG: hypothetical protein HN509_13685 [Halobacteriovoraceae bacterium]|jgi:catechol 2,3-dioxygenase-like lactoylglutathione lyase family enzyme|nr:hypothetical protein [Halobacteriovoraceae bacterium]MBT5093394.1 hypothetical protein [Halobacteriovoraceae bacterium]